MHDVKPKSEKCGRFSSPRSSPNITKHLKEFEVSKCLTSPVPKAPHHPNLNLGLPLRHIPPRAANTASSAKQYAILRHVSNRISATHIHSHSPPEKINKPSTVLLHPNPSIPIFECLMGECCSPVPAIVGVLRGTEHMY